MRNTFCLSSALAGSAITSIVLLLLMVAAAPGYSLVVEDTMGRSFKVDVNLSRSDCETSANLFTNLPQFPVVYCEKEN